MNDFSISVIIPTYNEEEIIADTIRCILEHDTGNYVKEIIIADGGSSDHTLSNLAQFDVRIVNSKVKGRAAQMNLGAGFATGRMLFFLHADTKPPMGFSHEIAEAIEDKSEAGCFVLSFDHDHWFLKTNAWLTRFDVDSIRFGDQGLFVTKALFEQCGGYDADYILLEDQEIVRRLKLLTRFVIIKKAVITSARKYLENGIYRTQFIYLVIYIMYRLHYSQQKLVTTYCNLIRNNKFRQGPVESITKPFSLPRKIAGK